MEALALAVLVAPWVAVGAWWFISRRTGGLAARTGEHVLVQLENTSLRGVLSGVYRDSLVLREAVELTEQGDMSLGSGVVTIPRTRVAYIQSGPEVLKDAMA